MKLRLLIATLFATPILMNCSSLNEIKPYEVPTIDPADADLVNYDPKDDSVFKDEVDLEDATLTPESDESTTASNESSDESSKEEPRESDSLTLVDSGEQETKIEKPSKPVRKPASHSGKMKSGMHTFTSECGMKTAPNSDSKDAGIVPAGKKLWLDVHNSEWLKAYKKAGTVYVPSQCVN